MLITALKSKIHRATVTHADKDYEGSCAIDGNLLDKVGIYENEQIHLYNVSNGERLITYAIRAENGSRIISVNGAAAWKAQPGDILIICAYAMIDPSVGTISPRIVYCDKDNNITHEATAIPVQVS